MIVAFFVFEFILTYYIYNISLRIDNVESRIDLAFNAIDSLSHKIDNTNPVDTLKSKWDQIATGAYVTQIEVDWQVLNWLVVDMSEMWYTWDVDINDINLIDIEDALLDYVR